MAQGFDRKQNLQESSTQISDRTILDNLGGENISADILLFDGNSAFRSKLVNSEYFLSQEEFAFGEAGFIAGRTYFIDQLGDSRDWTAIAVDGNIFTHAPSGRANAFIAKDPATVSSSVFDTGSGGVAREMVVRQDFRVFQDPNTDNAWTFEAMGINKVGFTNGTLLSVDDGETYPYLVINHDSENKFRLVSKFQSPPYTSLDIIDPNTLGDVDNLTLTRSDTITAENLDFMSSERLITNDEAGGSDPESQSGSEEGGEGDMQMDDGNFFSAFSTFSAIGYVSNLTSQIKYKKTRIPRTYEDSFFDENVRIGGNLRISNSDELEIGYPRDLNTALVVGAQYRITTRGNATVAQLNAISGESRTSYAVNDTFVCATTSTASGTTTRVKASNPPGLFIYNSSTGEEIRAFSGTDQPWEELSTGDANHPSYITGNALRTITQKIDIRREPFSVKPISNNAPILSKANWNSGTGDHDFQTTTPTGSNPEATATHKIGVTVNGVQYYLLVALD